MKILLASVYERQKREDVLVRQVPLHHAEVRRLACQQWFQGWPKPMLRAHLARVSNHQPQRLCLQVFASWRQLPLIQDHQAPHGPTSSSASERASALDPHCSCGAHFAPRLWVASPPEAK